MKQFTKIAMLAAAAALASPGARAAFKTNDLYLGFNNPSAASDYIIDLGQAMSAVGVGGASVVDLSSLVSASTFSNVFSATGVEGVNVAVVGGNNQFPNYSVYATQVRTGGVGAPAAAGSSLAAAATSQSVLSGAAATLTGHPWPTAGAGTNDSTQSYTTYVGPAQVGGNFYSKSGVNAFGTFDSSGVIYLDLWNAATGNAYVYKGYFKVDLSGATPSLTFTPQAAAVAPPPPPAPALRISRSGPDSYISFLSASNTAYRLFYTNTSGLSTPVTNWPSLGGTLTGDGTTNTFHDISVEPVRFYKVQAQ
jgi:hypothetical protein